MKTEDKLNKAKELNDKINELKIFINVISSRNAKINCAIGKEVTYSFLSFNIYNDSLHEIEIPSALVDDVKKRAELLLNELKYELKTLFK